MTKQNKYYITKYGEQKSALYAIILMRIQAINCLLIKNWSVLFVKYNAILKYNFISVLYC